MQIERATWLVRDLLPRLTELGSAFVRDHRAMHSKAGDFSQREMRQTMERELSRNRRLIESGRA